MNFNKLIPELSVSNLNTSLEFYVGIVGFKIEYERAHDKFAFLSLDSAQLMLEEDNGNWETGDLTPPRGRGINFQIEVADLKPMLDRIRNQGISLFREPELKCRRVAREECREIEFLVQDPDGYLLRFSESK